MPSPLPQIRAIRTLVGNQLVFTEAPPTVTLQTGPTPPVAIPSPPSPAGPYQTVALNPAGIQAMTPATITLQSAAASQILITPGSITLTVGGSSIAITPGGITITAPTVSIAGVGLVSVNGALVTIN
jgi:hypothetical protein